MAQTLWCTSCGSAIPEADSFCYRCGAPNAHIGDQAEPSTPTNEWQFVTETLPLLSSMPPSLPGSATDSYRPSPPRRRWLVVALVVMGGILIVGSVSVVGIRLLSDHGKSKADQPSQSATSRATTIPSASPKSSDTGKASATPIDFSALYAQASSGVVRIETIGCNAQGVGTGFLLSPTLVATVNHVIADSAVISLIAGKQRTTGTVIGSDPATDLALVQANRPLTGHQFQLAGADPAVGSRVAAIGFPIGDPITLTVGDISGLDRNITVEGEALTGLIETDTPLNPGNSGGPLMTPDGKVAGLVDAGRLGANGIGYAVPARVAAGKYGHWQQTPQPAAAVPCSNPLGPPQQANPNLTAPKAGDITATQAAGIAAAFNTYFGGINTGNYAAAWAVLSPRLQAQLPFVQFKSGTSTSYDSDLLVLDAHGIAPDSALVVLGFNSLQAPANGPDGETCDNWTLEYTLIQSTDGAWQIDAASPHNGSTHTAC